MKYKLPNGFYLTFTLATLLRLVAWVLVPIALIRAKKIAMSTIVDKLPYGHGADIQRYQLPKWAEFLEVPDDYNFPSYEPAMLKMYRKFGWGITTWWNLSFRNVGSALMWKYLIPVSGYDYQIDITERTSKGVFKNTSYYGFLKLISGYSSHRNWKQYKSDSIFVAIPSISLRLKSQD